MGETAFLVLQMAVVAILFFTASGIIRRTYAYWLFKKNGLEIYQNQLLWGMFSTRCGCGHPSWYGDFVKSNGKAKWLVWTLKEPMPCCHKCLSKIPSYPCRCGELILVFDKAFIVGKFGGTDAAEIICGQCQTADEKTICLVIWNPSFLEVVFERTAPQPAGLSPIANCDSTRTPTHLASSKLH